MSMACAFGPMAAPRAAECPAEPDATHFRVGDVWLNSRGTPHKVFEVWGRVASMVNMKTGRTHSRAWDAIGAHTNRPWIRESWGGQS